MEGEVADVDNAPSEPALPSFRCDLCCADSSLDDTFFHSRTKLFAHLEEIHGMAYTGTAGKSSRKTKKRTVALLIGWLVPTTYVDNDKWISEGSEAPIDKTRTSVENYLLAAIYAMENAVPPEKLSEVITDDGELLCDKSEIFQGYSRSSNCSHRASFLQGQEGSCHSLAETLSYIPVPPASTENSSKGALLCDKVKWINAINEILSTFSDYTVRVLDKVVLPEAASGRVSFHAEGNCTQRRYEYMLPLDLLIPTEDQTKVFDKDAVEESDDPSFTNRKAKMRYHKGLPMDQQFPTDTAEGRARVFFFREMKKILKLFGAVETTTVKVPGEGGGDEEGEGEGDRVVSAKGAKGERLTMRPSRASLHNFATGGASPGDAAAMRKVDRMYHKELCIVDGSRNNSSGSSNTNNNSSIVRNSSEYRGSNRINLLPNCSQQSQHSSIPPEEWAVFSISGDAFMRGQLRKMMGLVIGMARGWLPPDYFALAMCPDRVIDVPAAPGWAMYIAECRFAFWEARFEDHRVDPRRRNPELEEAKDGLARIEQWKHQVHQHVSVCSKQHAGWMDQLQADCMSLHGKYLAWFALENRPLNLLANRLQVIKREDWDFGEGTCKIAAAIGPIVEKDEVKLMGGIDGSGSVGKMTDNDSMIAADVGFCSEGNGDRHSVAVLAQYREVLRLLRAADTSGLWPASSVGRKAVIEGAEIDDETKDGEGKGGKGRGRKGGADGDWEDKKGKRKEGKKKRENGEDGEREGKRKGGKGEGGGGDKEVKPFSAPFPGTLPIPPGAVLSSILIESNDGKEEELKCVKDVVKPPEASRGGSFSVGVLGSHCAEPKGNALFPDLLRACFQLERVLMPDRPPSSTIAINRHAQFKPHRDSGAGSGQSKSLIVALGQFAGGEIVVESKAHDIRYKPLEFDGWGDKHWTLPFEGDRYSLVWFTPRGVTQDDLWWWKDQPNTLNTPAK